MPFNNYVNDSSKPLHCTVSSHYPKAARRVLNFLDGMGRSILNYLTSSILDDISQSDQNYLTTSNIKADIIRSAQGRCDYNYLANMDRSFDCT